MRTARNERLQDLEEGLGLITPRPVIPQIKRRPAGRRFVISPSLHRMNSWGYVSWMAFLVFWIVFGRLMIVFYMTTHGFGATQGVPLRLLTVSLAAADLEELAAGGVVADEDGRVVLDAGRDRVYQVQLQADRRLTIDGREWNDSDAADLCLGSSWVVISLPRGSMYEDAVSAVDLVHSAAIGHSCEPRIALVSSE